MSASCRYPRTNPKRILCYKTAAFCGNKTGSRLYRMMQMERINEARAEIRKIPDRRLFTWGEGQMMGTFVARRGKQTEFAFDTI